MAVQRKHPSAYVDESDVWTDEEYALGPEDELCAWTKRRGDLDGPNRLFLSGYGFNIPSNANITRVEIGIKSVSCNAYGLTYAGPMYFVLRFDDTDVTVSGIETDCPISCADAAYYKTSDITSILDHYGKLYPGFFNNEEFTSFCYQGGGIAIGNEGYLDAVYIEVEYTVPIVAKHISGDGLVWIVS